jgi:hypothetical protein
MISILPTYSGFLEMAKMTKITATITWKNKDRLIESGIALKRPKVAPIRIILFTSLGLSQK